MSILGNPICMPIGGKAAKGSNLFLAVNLPRSIYYEQAAEWLKIKDDPKAAIAETQWDGQVVCGNSLWLLYGNHAYAYSLEDGELLEDVELTGASGNYCNAICTDGVSRIWFVRISVSAAASGLSALNAGYMTRTDSMTVYEFDIGTKSVKNLATQTSQRTQTIGNYGGFGGQITAQSNFQIGYIGYSSSSHAVYFGKPKNSATIRYTAYYSNLGNQTGTTSITVSGCSLAGAFYDLNENQLHPISSYPSNDNFTGLFFYDDADFVYMGGGYEAATKGARIDRYNKLSNTWESITTAFEGYTVGPFSYVQLGDKILQISQTATGIFDPTTGNLDQASVPTVPPDNTVIYPGFKAYANNMLYLITAQGVYKCPFFSEVPADAPIVAKIYKGQKYHTLEPFSIPNKVNFTRTQQVATQDIEIKMYEYASEGGQTIYIEDTGEDA